MCALKAPACRCRPSASSAATCRPSCSMSAKYWFMQALKPGTSSSLGKTLGPLRGLAVGSSECVLTSKASCRA
eukprot:9022-Heterococcus_DN1.PRE.1